MDKLDYAKGEDSPIVVMNRLINKVNEIVRWINSHDSKGSIKPRVTGMCHQCKKEILETEKHTIVDKFKMHQNCYDGLRASNNDFPPALPGKDYYNW